MTTKPYKALNGAHVIALFTELDEFKLTQLAAHL